MVFDPADAWDGPGSVHRFVVFSARAGGAPQAYNSVGHMRLDMTAVNQCVRLSAASMLPWRLPEPRWAESRCHCGCR